MGTLQFFIMRIATREREREKEREGERERERETYLHMCKHECLGVTFPTKER